MEPGKLNLLVPQGTTWSKQLNWIDSDDDPVPLAGYTARMQVRKTVATQGTPVLSLTTENGRITLGPGDGEILLSIDATTTAALPTNRVKQTWRYDLELVSGGGAVTRLLEGKFVVTPEVTRA